MSSRIPCTTFPPFENMQLEVLGCAHYHHIKWTLPSYGYLKLNFANFTLGNIGDMRIGKEIKDNRDRSLEKISTSYDLTIEAEILVLLKQLIKVATWVSVSS